MNTIRATVFLLALSLSGGCTTLAPNDSQCEGAKLRQITITYQRHSNITVSPDSKRVSPGEAINYKVRGPKPRDFKATGTSGPAPYEWLNATGRGEPGGRSHIVCVPADQEHGVYEYMITIDDVGTLDPEVHVD